MFDKIIQFSLENKLLVLLGVLALVIMGGYSATQIPLDAVPDITNNQVQIVSTSPTLAPQEMEQLITYPIESAMTNLPGVEEVRSISRYGLSVVTVVFVEDMDGMLARQYVQEQLNIAKGALPEGLTEPELMPITTGLGEIYQYVLTVDSAHLGQYDVTELRTIQDWIVKRQLNGTKGVIEVSSFGGNLKQYEVAVSPDALKSHQLTMQDVIHALKSNNQNSGGSYIEKGPYSYYIRTTGRLETMDEIRKVPVANKKGVPITIGDVAQLNIGSAKRYGAMTMDGQGEVVGGITLMLKGANTSEVLANVKNRVAKVQKSLPKGVHIYPYLDRSKLIARTISTVERNLLEGGLIVIFVLLILLGNLRAGLVVASVIPLSLLFALTLMRYFGISANLMSLGAIDFGIVIDGAVIIVEGLLHALAAGYVGTKLTQQGMDNIVKESTSKIYRSAAFGVLIILLVFIPILTLEGTEGKTFRPMAQTVGFAVFGSLVLSLTYVPVMVAIFLKKDIKLTNTFADKVMRFLRKLYQPSIQMALKRPFVILGIGVLAFIYTLLAFNRLGAEFVPTLEEGDIAMQQSIKPGSSLDESIHTSSLAEKIILKNFPEVKHVISKIGTAEVPTDPMAIEDADVMIIMKDKAEWVSASTREEMMDKMKEKLASITWASFEFTQPIQLRFNELMTGSKSDISVKLFGEDVAVLKSKADEVAAIVEKIPGAGDVKVDQTDGLQQLNIKYDRQKLAQYGISVEDANQVIRAAYAGEQVGNIFEEERKFDLVVRVNRDARKSLKISQLNMITAGGYPMPISGFASVDTIEGPMLISREQAKRFINIGINVRDRDVASLVADISNKLDDELVLPAGYELQYGGQYKNLENASKRLMVAVPIALFLILLLLFMAFGNLVDALTIFIAVPLSAVGGVIALQVRGMPFSISSGIGFIALFGVSVLNGIVLLSAIKQLDVKKFADLKYLVTAASVSRLRPVLMTALVAALGFIPMALSTGSGAEVQRPLATVVIGGLISSTLLTLLILPTIYYLINRKKWATDMMMIIFLVGFVSMGQAQSPMTIDNVVAHAISNHPSIQNVEMDVDIELLNKKAINAFDPLEMGYYGGQLNGKDYDHNLMVQQDISPLFRKKGQAEYYNNKVKSIAFQKQLLGNRLNFELRKDFNHYAYLQESIKLLRELDSTYAKLKSIIDSKIRLGDVDFSEQALLEMRMLAQKNRIIRLTQNKAMLASDIRQKAYLDEEVELADIEFYPFAERQYELEMNSLILQSYQLQATVLDADAKLNKRLGKQPNLSIGYQFQSFQKQWGFHGFFVIAGIPIDRRKIRSKNEQITLRRQQVLNNKEYEVNRIALKIKQLKSQLITLQSSMDNLKQIQAKSKNWQSLLLKQYEYGEIDFLRFSQIQEQFIQNRMDYLDLVKAWNDAQLQLSFLTQK
ncbi:MAG TPA: CusA/CzcA family heavy metal efflux RND transporter [Saprospiraceae bacterium]|nr:CusA/CzcA family heavy metal efflux RND transporter [Saprospiraceae bacterium]